MQTHGTTALSIEGEALERRYRRDLLRLRNVTLVVIPLIVAHVVYFALSRAPGMPDAQLRWRDAQLRVMAALLVLVVALSVAALQVWRKPTAPVGWRSHLVAAFGLVFVWGTACVATADQLVTSAITPFVTASLGVAIVLRLGVGATLAVFGGGLVVLETGVFLVQQASDARTSSLLNGITLTGICIAVSITLTRAFDATEQARLTIDRQSREIERLKGFVRICAWCKRVSNEEGKWEPLEKYVARSSGVHISHSVCEDCDAKLVAEDGRGEAG
jgi:hypothetical protein